MRHSWYNKITGLGTRVTRRVPLVVEQKLLSLPENLKYHLVCWRCSCCSTFSFFVCSVCMSLFVHLRIPMTVRRFTDSGYLFWYLQIRLIVPLYFHIRMFVSYMTDVTCRAGTANLFGNT